jgi:hypothetical protein
MLTTVFLLLAGLACRGVHPDTDGLFRAECYYRAGAALHAAHLLPRHAARWQCRAAALAQRHGDYDDRSNYRD